MDTFSGKVAVVTGAASGIGRALADRFASEGMAVVLADVEQGPLQAAVEQIVSNGGRAIGVRTDVRYEEQVQALADQTIDAFGVAHILCNNAGVAAGAPFADIPMSAWKWVIDVNLYGVIHGCRIFLPLMRQQGEGWIVNTGSSTSFDASAPTFAPYSASKFAVLGLTENLDLELRASEENIGISLLAPGPVRTQMVDSERNRPSEVPATEPGTARATILDNIRSHTEAYGLEPAAVAEMVIDGIRRRQFFILTDPEPALAAVGGRLDRMTGGEAPAPWEPGV
jgi:NAD(P)-dependent dehydrogenase (short-subunit alcohol dehydrogenase family)